MTNFRQRKDLGNNISKNKFNDKPPYKFNNKDIKEIDIKNIKLNENDISYNNKNMISNGIINLNLFGKTLNKMTKNSDALKNKYIIYFFYFHTKI